MNITSLIDLRDAVARAIEYAEECGADPATIPVSLQIESDSAESVVGTDPVELHYDNNSCASGCVITAWVDEY
jgi:hypothetical protein